MSNLLQKLAAPRLGLDFHRRQLSVASIVQCCAAKETNTAPGSWWRPKPS